jgi:hypothetical protein
MWQPIKPKPDVRDLNRPADPGDMWEDRVFATCLARPEKSTAGAPRSRVNLTVSMRLLLARKRRDAGMSGDEVARAMGHTQSWVAHVELGNVQTIEEEDFDRLMKIYTDKIERGIDPEDVLRSVRRVGKGKRMGNRNDST